MPANSGWGDDYRSAAHDVTLAWSDPAKLDQVLDVPWNASPGAALMFSYTVELAVHGWDLAKATGREFTIDDDLLHGALVVARWIPAEGRDTPAMPFSPVVDHGPDASSLDQMAGWMGRDVLP